jgi:hypothetical protein
VNGLAGAWLIAIPIVFAINFPRIAGSMGISLLHILRVVWATLLAGGLMYAAVTGVRTIIPVSIPWLALLVHILVGGIVYVAAVVALDRRMIPEMKRVVAAFRG